MGRRVAVTGIGMIDTLGNNPDDCYSAYSSDHYIDPVPYEWHHENIQNVFRINSEVKLPDINPKTVRTFEDNIKFGLHAVDQALKDSGVPHSKNVAVVASNVTSGDGLLYYDMPDIHARGKMRQLRAFLSSMRDFFPSFICQHYGFEGVNVALNGACATALYNIDYAMKIVDQYDYVVCAVSDDPVNPLTISFFTAAGALGTMSIPFNPARDGFIPGQGGACFILESEEKAIARGAHIHAYLHPVGFASDAYAATAPSPDGRGAKMAMERATAAFRPHTLSFVSAHAPSTPVGDDIERDAIHELFGEIDIVAPKRKIGHTMGTCGMLEAIYGIKTLKSGYFLNNSFGFGGKCASQVVEMP